MKGQWIAVTWQHPIDMDNESSLAPVEITRMRSPFYKGERFAVRRLSQVLNTKATWEHEGERDAELEPLVNRQEKL